MFLIVSGVIFMGFVVKMFIFFRFVFIDFEFFEEEKEIVRFFNVLSILSIERKCILVGVGVGLKCGDIELLGE